MFEKMQKGKNRIKTKAIAVFVNIFFLINTFSSQLSFGQIAPVAANTSLWQLSAAYSPLVIKGLKIDPQNPLKFNFIIDIGDLDTNEERVKEEALKVVKYFLTSLTVSENDLWVNLSPYERERIIPGKFGDTEMGRDLLQEDYILKQITSSLIYPEDELGSEFWEKVYAKVYEKYGKSDIPSDVFNKVWIVPKKASVFEESDSAYIIDSELKVLLEEDYIAASKIKEQNASEAQSETGSVLIPRKETNEIFNKTVREVIIPALEEEVNRGKNFAQLRQIYNAIILSAWFKGALKESMLGKLYVDQNKISGVELADKKAKEEIYNSYLEAVKKGVYDYVKEDYIEETQSVVKRKYFSGGTSFILAGATNPRLEVHNAVNMPREEDIDRMMASEEKAIRSGRLRDISIGLNEGVPADYPELSGKGAGPDQMMAGESADKGKNLRYFYLLLPLEVKRILQGEDLDGLVASLNEQNYKEEKYLAILYLLMRSSVVFTSTLDFPEFAQLCREEIDSPNGVLVSSFVNGTIKKKKLALTPAEQRLMAELSYDIHNGISKIIGAEELSAITFRELMRFNVDFSRYYLRSQNFKDILDVFIITIGNIYGSLLNTPERIEKLSFFIERLITSQSYQALFNLAVVESDIFSQGLARNIHHQISYGDYDNTKVEIDGSEVNVKQNVKALIKRSLQVSRDLLLKVDSDNSFLVEEVLREQAQDPDNVMVRLSMSHYSKRGELLGTYLPKEEISEQESELMIESAEQADIKKALKEIFALEEKKLESFYQQWSGSSSWRNDTVLKRVIAAYLRYGKDWRVHMQWKDGVLLKMAKAAQDNKKKQYTIVLDNISAADDNFRLLLNPILWERTVEIREIGVKLKLPKNLQFIMTMHKETEIKDPSFLNRPLIHEVNAVTESDISVYFRNNFSFSDEIIKKLAAIYSLAKSQPFSEDANLGFTDLIEIARRVKGVSIENKLKEEDIFDKEAYNYLFLRLKNDQDRAKLKANLFPRLSLENVEIYVNAETGKIDFDGVELAASADLIKRSKGPRQSFSEVMRETGYVAEETEQRVLAQLARQYKYGNKTVQLEGPSGEGKTEVGRVFTSILALNLREYTVNEDTDLGELRGKIRPAKDGSYELTRPAYLNEAANGGNVFLFNEINTSEDAALYYWFYPEFSQRPEKHLTEFPEDKVNEFSEITKINRNNLWLFTVNPQSFKGRNKTPPIVTSHVPCFQMASDPKLLSKKIRNLFNSEGLNDHLPLADKLANIHNLIRELKLSGKLRSPQDITPRDYLDVTRRFRFLINKGEPVDSAFNQAVWETYLYMWQFMEDINRVKEIVNKETGSQAKLPAKEILRSSLSKSQRPVLVLHNGANEILELESEIEAIDSRVIIVNVPVSYFHNSRQILGGLMPKEKEDTYPEELAALKKMAPMFEERLGILPSLIQRSRFAPLANVYAIFTDYTLLNSQTAPLLNEFLQTGKIENIREKMSIDLADALIDSIKQEGIGIWERLRKDYPTDGLPQNIDSLKDVEKIDFACWFYGEKPENLKIIATGTSEEPTRLSVAEINRFRTVNISETIDRVWINNYIASRLSDELKPNSKLIMDMVLEVYDAYQAQIETNDYKHNRLSKKDIDVLLAELEESGNNNIDKIKEIAYYVIGIGLRPQYRDKLSFSFAGKKSSFKLSDDKRFLTPTLTLTHQIASLNLALKHNRIIVMEGFPGGGKTSGVEDMAARLGLPFYSDMMFEDIDLRGFLGTLTKQGSKFLLNALQKDNKGEYLLPFLKAYSSGGVYLLDEGAIGVNSREVISHLARLAQEKEIDLGNYHPGQQGNIIRKHKDFHLVIAQNPANSTVGREHIPYAVDTLAHKIWTDNTLTLTDAVKIIDYYLDEPGVISGDIKESIARLHIKYSEIHPNKEEISPRQLIMISKAVNRAAKMKSDINRAIFEGIIAGYITRVENSDASYLWKEVTKEFKGKLDLYLHQWNQPVDIEEQGKHIRFNGTLIPVSATKTNITEDQIEVLEQVPSRNKILREIALGISMNMPVALLEEKGADSLDIARNFALKTGYEFHTLWSHPQMTRMHLLSSVLPEFDPVFDSYGIRRESISEQFITAFGFLARHLVEKNAYLARPDKNYTQKILFFHLMDSIPEQQRIMLNDLLTRKEIEFVNAKGERVKYIIPSNVHIVLSSSINHKFSSAFINRFLSIRVKPLTDDRELMQVIGNRYPLVNKKEIRWINKIAQQVSKYEQSRAFSYHYGYSARDVFKLAEIIQTEKQKDIEKNQFKSNPLYYLFKATRIVYIGLDESGDYPKFEQEIIKEFFLYNLRKNIDMAKVDRLYNEIKQQVDDELSQIEHVEHIIRIDVSGVPDGKKLNLANGLSIKREKDSYIINVEGGNVYRVKDSDLAEWVPLEKEDLEGSKRGDLEPIQKNQMWVKKEGQHLVLKLMLISSIGGVEVKRDQFNLGLSLPEQEIPNSEYLKHTRELRILESALLRSWMRVEDNLGRIRTPRVVMLEGLTGTAKTTLIRNLRRTRGVPLYILNSDENVKASDITFGLGLKAGRFELGIKEFLAQVGLINGKRIRLPSQVTSNRKMLLIDEANASPELLFALAPLFRGEKKFTFEYAGESFDVELDEEVMIVLTFNPAETHAGRGSFAEEITAHADKIWSPNPLKYDRKTIVDILLEYHRRGMTKETQELKEGLEEEGVLERQGHEEVEPQLFKVRDLAHPPVRALKDVLSLIEGEEEEEEPAPEEEQKIKKKIKKVDLNYDLEAVKERALSFRKEDGFLEFAEQVLQGYLLAVANGNRDAVLNTAVIKAARLLSLDLADSIKDF
ncbi:MAG: AAA family ATPase, partial [Candidatus Omnitrophica bacterium]|nr:AAA family ATPase [Candidatus Omnitrophota bacterium]